jgi:hypothetical protein
MEINMDSEKLIEEIKGLLALADYNALRQIYIVALRLVT